MDLDSYYTAGAALVERDTELQKARYKTKDGRYVISSTDLRALSMRGLIKPDEYVSGLDLEEITDEEAHRLISEGGYTIGQQTVETASAEEQNPSGQQTEETADNDNIENDQTEEENSDE